MKPGSYQRALEFDKIHHLQTLQFRPHLYKGIDHEKLHGSCGSLTISTITGVHPNKVAKKLAKTTKAWTDRSIRKTLSQLGYRTVPITMCDVTNNATGVIYPIRLFHVLLVSQLMIRNEGSWAVVHRNRIYHNMEEEKLDPLEFINNPLMTVYAVWHKKWTVRDPKIFSALEDPLFRSAIYSGNTLSKMQLRNMVGYTPRYHYA